MQQSSSRWREVYYGAGHRVSIIKKRKSEQWPHKPSVGGAPCLQVCPKVAALLMERLYRWGMESVGSGRNQSIGK